MITKHDVLCATGETINPDAWRLLNDVYDVVGASYDDPRDFILAFSSATRGFKSVDLLSEMYKERGRAIGEMVTKLRCIDAVCPGVLEKTFQTAGALAIKIEYGLPLSADEKETVKAALRFWDNSPKREGDGDEVV
ncbi:MAG: hypothetical protein LUC22_01400 [Prevotella sp.]|nr:hypothetical protein [Prevotella sp.]